jgi:hypothetical protein
MKIFTFFVVKVTVQFIRKGISYNRIKVGRNGEKREKHSLLLMRGMGVNTQFLLLYCIVSKSLMCWYVLQNVYFCDLKHKSMFMYISYIIKYWKIIFL